MKRQHFGSIWVNGVQYIWYLNYFTHANELVVQRLTHHNKWEILCFCWHYNTGFARESDVWMTWKGGNNVSLRNAKAPWDIFLRVSLQHEYELHTGKQTHTDAYCGHKSLLDNFRSCFSHLSFFNTSLYVCILIVLGPNWAKSWEKKYNFLKTNPKCDWIWWRAKEFKRGQKIDVLEKLLAGLEQVGVGGLWGLWKTNDRTNTFGRTTTRGMIQWDKGW